jgi:hypothetical protein
LTRVLSLAVSSAITLQTIALVTSGQVCTVSLDAGVGEALIDVDVAGRTLEAGALAVTLERVEQVGAAASVARVGVTFVDLVLAVLSRVTGRANAFVVLK